MQARRDAKSDFCPNFRSLTQQPLSRRKRGQHRALGRQSLAAEPGGRLLIEVPNYASPWRRVFRGSWLPLLVPQHVTHFTPDALARLVRDAGFDVVHQQGMFFPSEPTVSLIIALARVLGVPGPDASVARRLLDLANAVWIAAFFALIDVPSQAVLAAVNRAGHQALVARKPR